MSRGKTEIFLRPITIERSPGFRSGLKWGNVGHEMEYIWKLGAYLASTHIPALPYPGFFQSRGNLEDSQILSNIIFGIPGILGVDGGGVSCYPARVGGRVWTGYTYYQLGSNKKTCLIRSNRKAGHYYCTPEQNAHCRMGLRAFGYWYLASHRLWNSSMARFHPSPAVRVYP